VQLFYLVNGWAGRVAWVDEAMRFFYVVAVPLLWTALAWALLVSPAREATSEREGARGHGLAGWVSSRRLALASLLALLGVGAIWLLIEEMARRGWNTETFSPRPFVTHRVNALVVEPNDNSYPCLEVMLASAAATLLWGHSVRAGAFGWAGAFLLGFARVFCGSNYPVDVLAGWSLGWASAALALAACRAPLTLATREGRLVWRRRQQAALSSGCIAVVLGAALLEVVGAAQAHRDAPVLMSDGRVASAPLPAPSAAPEDAGRSTEVVAPTPQGEGMGRDAAAPLVAAPSQVGDENHGRQPTSEARVRQALGRLKLEHRVLEIEVAQVTVGNSPFRVAGVQFEVRPQRPSERRRVAQSATRIVRSTFASDPSVQNVDVVGVIFSSQNGASHASHGSLTTKPSFEGEGSGTGETALKHSTKPRPVPVFTASVQKRNLAIINGPQWANAPGADEGLWLRARSRLFIDPKVLPAPPQTPPPPTPQANTPPTPTAAPTATPLPAPTATPVATATPAATSTLAAPTAAPAKRIQVAPIKPLPRPTARRPVSSPPRRPATTRPGPTPRPRASAGSPSRRPAPPRTIRRKALRRAAPRPAPQRRQLRTRRIRPRVTSSLRRRTVRQKRVRRSYRTRSTRYRRRP
jgi:membrane-associated phospholipid phosphatase